MNMQIADATDRVWTLQRDYFNALRDVRYGEQQTHKRHIAEGNILEKIKPHQIVQENDRCRQVEKE